MGWLLICSRPIRFNTQPPEGGWDNEFMAFDPTTKFQHTAARRRLGQRPETPPDRIGFNTQPPEGGWVGSLRLVCDSVCFNTQPPEGGWPCKKQGKGPLTSFNTQPPEGGWGFRLRVNRHFPRFQHTAARRRLEYP